MTLAAPNQPDPAAYPKALPKTGSFLAVVIPVCMLGAVPSQAQPQDSLAGEAAAQALKRAIDSEQSNLRLGPAKFQIGASVGASYTDNVFYSHNQKEDFLINPEVTLGALWPISDLNTMRLSLGLGYEWYLKNHVLNSDAPLVNPGSELEFNLFVGDFRIRPHERFSYQESLFFNSLFGDNARFYNLNNIGTFARLDNQVGVDVDWDLNKVVLSAGYNHEDFDSYTAAFDYLSRASEWFTASASFALGDKAHAGLESQASLHHYASQTILNDNWRVRGGPFAEAELLSKVTLRGGGGFDTAQYDSPAADNNNFQTYYAYARIRQELRLFSHSLKAGHENLLGENANNMRTTYVRYSITSPVVAHLELEGNLSVNFAREFGGAFDEKFTYYGAGFRVEYPFHKNLTAGLSYEFRLKESNLPLRDFDRNRVTVQVIYTF
jgi:hypothetical protein